MITVETLLNIGFHEVFENGQPFYMLNGYGLKPQAGSWLIISNNNGQLVTGLSVIDTIDELRKHYNESTGQKL
jgi:hypothetical protein